MENCSRTFLAVYELPAVRNGFEAAWEQTGNAGHVGGRTPGDPLIGAVGCQSSSGKKGEQTETDYKSCFLPHLLSVLFIGQKHEANVCKASFPFGGQERDLGHHRGELVGGGMSFLLDHLLPAAWGPLSPDPKGTGVGDTPQPSSSPPHPARGGAAQVRGTTCLAGHWLLGTPSEGCILKHRLEAPALGRHSGSRPPLRPLAGAGSLPSESAEAPAVWWARY